MVGVIVTLVVIAAVAYCVLKNYYRLSSCF